MSGETLHSAALACKHEGDGDGRVKAAQGRREGEGDETTRAIMHAVPSLGREGEGERRGDGDDERSRTSCRPTRLRATTLGGESMSQWRAQPHDEWRT